ncbi:MAG: helix-turn-helix transcriptional regulator [Acidobacteria bacterium]|nr:helix-turn-helix transcriptional regulator [Acidobacteriota bacterium]
MGNIDALLDRLGSKSEVADGIGISRPYLYAVRTGRKSPTARTILRILTFMNRPENLAKLERVEPVRFEELFH